MSRWMAILPAAALLLAAACGSDRGAVQPSITVLPANATVLPNAQVQFTATVSGLSDTGVTWSVNGVAGGNSTVGTISSSGLYTAPSTVPNPSSVTITATSTARSSVSGSTTLTIDSGISVSLSPTNATLGTSEQLQFIATVTGTTNTTVNWTVNDVAGGNSTVGTISASGVYTAPATVPSPGTITIKATSAADTSRSASAVVILVAAATPTLTSISPTSAAQGAAFLDLYVTGSSFTSATLVRLNGIAAPTTFLTTTLLRARLPASTLATAGSYNVDVLPFGGLPTPPLPFNIVPVRPALVGPSPDSVTQGSGAATVNFNGGYFSPSVTTEFNGNLRASTIASSRQLGVALSAADLGTAGLFPVAVRNTAATPSLAIANLAIQPSVAPSIVATLPVGNQPSAVAVNPATGIAIVANRGSNSISLIDLATSSVTATIPVGTAPAGVAVDYLRNLAYVTNSGSNDVSVVDLASASVTATISGFTQSPISVAVNPFTQTGLVTLANTNASAIIDTATNQIVSVAAAASGDHPRVDIYTRLNWAITTPGGAGIMTIVDLARRTSIPIAATSGASRSNNVVTITTASDHGLSVGQSVLISGVADPSFNGIFSITSIPTTSSFTYAQTGSNATSSGGTVVFTLPMATVNLGVGVRGISINPETSTAFLSDPNFTTGIVFSLLDQSVTNVQLEARHVATAVNPFTNIGVSLNENLDELSVVDLRTPIRLFRLAVGTDPRAVAIDPGTNLAIVANEGSNDVSIVNLGPIRPLHLLQVSPDTTYSGSSPLTLSILGHGFSPASAVRLDETPIPTTFVSSRQLTATVPAALLASARRFALDVEDSGVRSNVSSLTVIQTVPVGTAPRSVAVDAERDLAIVANSGSDDVSLVDMNTGAVTATIAVGDNPQGVATLPRAARAVVTNRGSNNVSVIDLAAASVAFTVNVGTEPIGVAINQDTGQAVVANASSNNVSILAADAPTPAVVNTVAADTRPQVVAIDPSRNRAVVLHSASNTAGIIDLGLTSPAIVSRVQGLQLPTGVVYDPLSDRYVIAQSLVNNLAIADPNTALATALRVGINPTSIAYNVNSSTLITVNTASQTMTVMDFLDRRVRAILPMVASPFLAVDIHPRTNIAAIADEANNRLLLVPLPR